LVCGLVTAAAVAGCDGGSTGGAPVDFAGMWDAISGTLNVQCTPAVTGQGPQPFHEFWERFTVSSSGALILLDVDQTGKAIDSCQFEYAVAGAQAGIKAGQTCQQVDGSTLTYPMDVYTRSADGMSLDETGQANVVQSDPSLGTCATAFTFHYVKL
jgi:hypothetical protein